MIWIDWMVVAAYAVATLAVGVVFARSSAKGLKSYFLGDNALPWWALAASGAASNFDIAGTMWLVSMVCLFGMRSFWAFTGFAIFNVAFLMAYLAPWIRRTRVMTAAELMKVRFGDGVDGRTARVASAVGMVVFTAFCLGYSAAGIGKFAAAFVPWDFGAATSFYCAAAVMSLTCLYVLIGGFRSVIVTDVIQAILMSLCGLVVGITAMIVVDPAALHRSGFITDLLPVWKWNGLPQDYVDSGFGAFGAMCILFMLNGLLHSTGGAGGTYGEQRFLATRTAADAARAGAAWGVIILPRFFLVAGIAFLVLTGMVEIPSDAEMLLPQAIKASHLIPVGVRGFVVAALLAALLMAVAIRCRSFKEAQASTTVVVLAASLLPLLTSFNGGGEQPWHLWLPALAQITLMQRVLEGGALGPADVLLPVLVAALGTALCLASVVRQLRTAAWR